MSTETKKLLVRMPRELHRWALDIAARTGENVSSLIRTSLRKELFLLEYELIKRQLLVSPLVTPLGETGVMNDRAAEHDALLDELAGENDVPT